MKDFLSTYPYLAWSLTLLSVFVAALIYTPREHRRLTVLSALLSAPFSLLSFAFVPEYWQPVRIVPFVVGPEDILFSFSTGGLVWVMAIWLVRHRLTFDLQPRQIFKRYLTCSVLAIISVTANLHLIHIKMMTYVVVSICFFGLWLLWIRRQLWPMAVSGVLAFTVFYFILLKIIMLMTPDFLYSWNLPNLWGGSICGVIQQEIVWAACFGAVWPLFAGYLFNVKISSVKGKG